MRVNELAPVPPGSPFLHRDGFLEFLKFELHDRMVHVAGSVVFGEDFGGFVDSTMRAEPTGRFGDQETSQEYEKGSSR